MSIFRRKKQDDFNEEIIFEQENLFDTLKKKDENAPKPNVLTADEISGDYILPENDIVPAVNPLDELKQKMISRQENIEKFEEDKEEEYKPFFNVDSSFLEIVKENIVDDEPIEDDIAVKITSTEETATNPSDEETTVKKAKTEESILESCLPFIMDGRESLPEEKPIYTLESVASIIGEEETETKNEPKEEKEEAEVFEETIIFKAIENDNMPDISDIDNNVKVVAEPPINFTGTMSVFINDNLIGNTRDVNISEELYKENASEQTFEEEIKNISSDDYEPEDEFVSLDDRRRIRFKLLKERRNFFVKFIISLLSTLTLSVFLLPAFSDMMSSFSIVLSVFTLVSYFATFIANIDIFKSLKTLKGNRTSAESVIALSCIFSLICIVYSIISVLESQIIFGISFSVVLSLLFRSFWRLKKSQYMYSNFTIIAADKDKYGITLIDDAPTTFAMARKAIDGNVLIAAPRRTRNITDFIKNSTIDVDFDGKIKLVFFMAGAVSIFFGIAFGLYRESLVTGITALASFSLLFAPLTSLACFTMPLSHTAKRLNKYGSVISGVKTARKLEEANACVVDCCDLFPNGCIQLADMKILNENNLEETITYAYAITSGIKSPLAHVFRKITDTSNDVEIPVADSVKYEEKLGITGWVGDKRVFIGNRSLMIAHEVAIPDSSVDKKILSDGCFPVYLAFEGKVLALIVLRYIPNPLIARELDKATALGLTVLINNCDQNISEEMICDYFDLYSDSVKIMSGSGVHMYKTATNYVESMNAGAVIRKSASAIAATVFAANKITKSISLLQIVHYITIVLGIILFGYAFFGSNLGYVAGIYLALYELMCYTLGCIAYLFTKP